MSIFSKEKLQQENGQDMYVPADEQANQVNWPRGVGTSSPTSSNMYIKGAHAGGLGQTATPQTLEEEQLEKELTQTDETLHLFSRRLREAGYAKLQSERSGRAALAAFVELSQSIQELNALLANLRG